MTSRSEQIQRDEAPVRRQLFEVIDPLHDVKHRLNYFDICEVLQGYPITLAKITDLWQRHQTLYAEANQAAITIQRQYTEILKLQQQVTELQKRIRHMEDFNPTSTNVLDTF